MGNTIGRLSGLLAAIVLLTIGILGIVPVVPKGAWIGLGIAGLVFILGQFAWERRSGSDTPSAEVVTQRQTGGPKSRNYQAGRDITFGSDNPPSANA